MGIKLLFDTIHIFRRLKLVNTDFGVFRDLLFVNFTSSRIVGTRQKPAWWPLQPQLSPWGKHPHHFRIFYQFLNLILGQRVGIPVSFKNLISSGLTFTKIFQGDSGTLWNERRARCKVPKSQEWWWDGCVVRSLGPTPAHLLLCHVRHAYKSDSAPQHSFHMLLPVCK